MSNQKVASPLPTARYFQLPVSLERSTPREAVPKRNSCASRVGAQVRSLRMATHISGSKLAQISGISASLLSRIERGLVSPSVDTLDRLAVSLRVPVSRLFAEKGSEADFCHVRAGQGLVVDRGGAALDYRHELLGHLLSGHILVEPHLVTLLPSAEPFVTSQHPGVKFLYFLSGEVTYRYGSKAVSVRAGDSVLFDANVQHGIEAFQHQPVSYLSVVLALRD
ncbi:helix-turn-helix domain-containing protein [Variovorax sp.]|uniref:helix-turn-helix domain-containing protein n=1 Tax=Variovorax sp. TaxID=1871043 RepID=UPI003BAB21C8